MSTDFENELRNLFREKAEEAPLATPTLPASAPLQVLRRGRLHQVGTVLGSMAVVIVLILGSVAGLTRILGEGGDDKDIGNGGYDVFQRTATVEAFTVGSPSDWYLVNRWPASMLIPVEGIGGSSSACVAVPEGTTQECDDTPGDPTASPIPIPSGLPMFQLSNVDLGLATNACADGLPSDAAVLYVAFDIDSASGLNPPWEPFPPGEPGLPAVIDGPCGPGAYSHFTVNGNPMFAWVGVGSDVSVEDRATVQTSYEMMSAIPDWEPTPPRERTPGYVIAGGASDSGDDWRLELRPGAPRPEFSLEGSDADPLASTIEDVLTGSSYEPAPTDPIFGAITKQATGVEFRPGTENTYLDLGQSPVAGTIVPIPPTMGAFDFDLFFIDPPADHAALGGHVIALGVDDEQTVSPPPAAEPRSETVEFSGTFEGHEWAATFRGSFADRTACIYVDMDEERQAPLCPTELGDSLASGLPSLHGWLTSFHLLAGSVPPEVVEIRFAGDDDAIVPQSFHCETGPLGWTDPDVKVCALLLPPGGSGTVEYLDAAGAVVSDEGIAWGTAEPEVPTPVSPVHGGTYWAVYPWVGAVGSPEADDVSAQLLEDFGIEALPGDLSCDDGAAEALGTDAPQGIGVYFETEEDANAFALQAGLLGHEADPVIARVTTYCLD